MAMLAGHVVALAQEYDTVDFNFSFSDLSINMDMTRKRTTGGKRRKATSKTRKLSKGAAAWNKHVMEVFKRMRKANPKVMFRDALVQAAKERKAAK